MSLHSTMRRMNLIPLTATKWRECGGSSIINSRSTCWLIVCSLLTEWVPALSGLAAGYPEHCIAVKVQWGRGGGTEQCCSSFDHWVLFLIRSALCSISQTNPVSLYSPKLKLAARIDYLFFFFPPLWIYFFYLFGWRSQCLSKNYNWNWRLISSQISPGIVMLNQMLSRLMLFAKVLSQLSHW